MQKHKHDWIRVSNKYSLCKCGKEKFVKYPTKDKNGKLIIKNLFKMDMMSIIFIIVIITMTATYKADIKQFEEIIVDPCGWCNQTNCYEHLNYLENQPRPIEEGLVINWDEIETISNG